MSYQSVYVWPNKAFPFRVYFESDNLRIFIIENLQHNYEWLNIYKKKIKKSDIFFVILGCNWSQFLLKNALDMFEYLGLDQDQFYILYNDSRDADLFASSGFLGEEINQNSWIDFNGSMQVIEHTPKLFDSIYVGRLIPVKRHYLANSVNNLALICGRLYGSNIEQEAPPHIYRNEGQLSPTEVCLKINESRSGLILSEREGACFASSEYLLCGIPVISTQSEGGRAVWYDDYNSILCSDNPIEISEAVQYFKENPRDPLVIRNGHIAKSQVYRQKFILKLAILFEKHGEHSVDANEYFQNNFIHKLRKSYAPNFDEIFNYA
jgi:glycosyltransferase involved in cell wall biosynthesis